MFEVKVPSPGESITEVEIATWLVKDGDYVEKEQVLCEVDSDKATLELPAEEAGIVTLIAKEGDAVNVGEIIAKIDTSAKAPAKKAVPAAAAKAVPVDAKKEEAPAPKKEEASKESYAKGTPSVAARKILDEKGADAAKVKGSGKDGRITKNDAMQYVAAGVDATQFLQGWGGTRDQSQEKMSMLRRKIAQRLVSVKNETAMLTTFNEVDMKPIMDLRNQYKDTFKEVHGVNLGFMGFFTKAVTEALRLYPTVNAMLDGDQMIFHDYADIGIAVSSPKGLMVPVVRNAEQMSLQQIEAEIKRLAIKARDGEISIDEMTGGTFTITNGGVFGSMLSTPIINPPQSAILGMHNIVDRPVAINGEVHIRPIMYLALSYDHRIIDGKESVSFLYKVKEMLEDPIKLMTGAKNPLEILLGL